MKKVKIAISLDSALLDIIETKIDGSVIRSRSQAIEYFLVNGLREHLINKAVILLKGSHQKCSITKINGTKLIHLQLTLLKSAGIKNVFIVTQKSEYSEQLFREIGKSDLNIKIVEKEAKGTAQALYLIKPLLEREEFVALSGDIYNNFNLINMINKHLEFKKAATIGVISKLNTQKTGTVVLDGDYIIDFEEKSKNPKSNIVNAGVYVFSSQIFTYINKSAISLETDVFPKLARQMQIIGFFTHGNFLDTNE